MKKLLLRTMLATALLCPFTQLAPQSQEEILNRIKSEKINFIQLNFTDIFGNPKSYTVTANMAESVLKRGTNFDGSSVAGLTNINESDLLLKPDIKQFYNLSLTV